MKNWVKHHYLEHTAVSSIGADYLLEVSRRLQFLADLLPCDVLLLVPGKEQGTVIITAKAEPGGVAKTGYGEVGEPLNLARERIIAEVFHTSKSFAGRKEVELGKFFDFKVFPVFDNAGLMLAAVGCIGNIPDTKKEFLQYVQAVLFLSIGEVDVFGEGIRAQDGILLFDHCGRLLYGNEIGHRLNKIANSDTVSGLRLDESTDIIPVVRARTERQVVAEEWQTGNGILAGRAIPLSENGQLVAILLLLSDVTLLREKEREIFVKDVVIREIHHRVKNNLQTVAGLLRMQARRGTPEIKEALHEAERRIHAIAAIHDILAKQIDDRVAIEELVQALLALMQREWTPWVDLQAQIAAAGESMSSDVAVTVGIITHELVQNACEHGQGAEQKHVRVAFSVADDHYVLRVENDGAPLPEDFSEASYHLGLQIVHNLVRANLHGQFTMTNTEQGVEAVCIFPKEEVSGG